MPFVIGWVIAMIANPLVRMLERRLKMVRKHSSALIVVAVLAAIIGLAVCDHFPADHGGLRPDPGSAGAVSHGVPGGGSDRRPVCGACSRSFLRGCGRTGRSWREASSQALGALVQTIASPTVEAAGNAAMRIPGLLVIVIVTILSSYFFIAERDRIIEFWRNHLPGGGSRYYGYLKADVKRLIGGYFLAQFKIMFVVAFMLFVGFLVLGIGYSGLLAVLIAMLDFLPIFGTGTVLIPWAIVKLLAGEYPLAVGLALLYVLTQVVRQLIQPKIVGDTMGLPALWTLVLLYLGFKVRGISGMILAVPLGIVVMNLYKYGAFDRLIESLKQLGRETAQLRKGAEGSGSGSEDD